MGGIICYTFYMKIAIFYLGQQGGAVAWDALETAVGLSHYAEVMCVVSSTSDNYNSWVEESKSNDKFHVIGVKTSKKYSEAIPLMLNFPKNRKIVDIINKFNPDVVYSYMGHPMERVFIPYIKCKIIAKGVHDVKTHSGDESLLMSIISRLLNYKKTHYVVYSDFSRCELEKTSIPQNQILTTFLGCNSRLVKKRDLDLKFYNRMLFFGRLIKYKGIDVLFNSLEEVFQKYPDCKLVMAGRGDISEYASLIEKYKNNLEIHNEWIEDDDLPNYFKGVDFLVAPYTDATQSGVVPLSNSFGKPAIVSNSGGLPEQVKDGITGLIIPKGDAVALTGAIIKMLEDKERLAEMKKQAYNYSKELTLKASAEKLYHQFENVVE